MLEIAKKLIDKHVWPEGCRDAAVEFALDLLRKDPESVTSYLPELIARRHRIAVNVRSQRVYTRPWAKEAR